MSSTATDAPGDTAAAVMTPIAKLEALRSKMKECDIDVYLVPSDDPHLSGKRSTAVVSPCLAFLSGSSFHPRLFET
jgi:hypothetical protein